MSKLSLACIVLITLSGCAIAETKPMTLSEELAGKTPEQKQEVLRLACLNAAEKITGRTSMWHRGSHGNVPIYDPKISHMKELCRQMTAAYLSSDKAQHVALMQQCSDQIGELPKNSATNTMHQICELMTK